MIRFKINFRFAAYLVLLLILVSACSAADGSSEQDAPAGKDLFKQSVIEGLAGCATCHSLEPGVIIIGPSLAGIGSTAAQRVAGKSAENYLRSSILEPDTYIVSGYPTGVMPNQYGVTLSEDEVNHLVEYLLTLE